MGELVETAKALSAPATKLVEVVSRGIGRAYDPRYKRKMADAAAYELDTLAGAIRRNGDVPILFDREGIQLDARSAQDLVERAQMRFFTQEVRKQQNIEAIVDKAYEELEKKSEVSSEPVDDDWIVRFFNSVEDVSNEKLQEIWAKILAGEIIKPKSFSSRTLDVIKNISKTEAELFEEVMSYSVELLDSCMLLYDIKSNRNFGIPYDKLRTLNECRLIDLMSIMNRNIKLDPNQLMQLESEELLIYIINDGDKPEICTLTYIPLTSTGEEMYRIINKRTNESGVLNLLKTQNLYHDHIIVEAYKIATNQTGERYANMSENIFE